MRQTLYLTVRVDIDWNAVNDHSTTLLSGTGVPSVTAERSLNPDALSAYAAGSPAIAGQQL